MNKIPHKKWMQSLEQERWNVANHIKTPPPCPQKHYTPREIRELQKMFYNAGRYAAGATDQVALKAHQKYEKHGK